MSVRSPRIVLATVLGITGIACGVYGDWILWHPMDGLMLTLAAGALLLVAGALALIPRRATRTAALGVLAFALGIVGGQVFSPGRPELLHANGTILVTLDQPSGVTGSNVASCQTTEAGDELQVSGDSNLRLDILGPLLGAPADLDQRAFVGVSMHVGDRWRNRSVSRADNVDLYLLISSPAGKTDETGEVMLAAVDNSNIEIAWTPTGGTLRFAGLVDVTNGTPLPAGLDLRGTITWTCGAASAPRH